MHGEEEIKIDKETMEIIRKLKSKLDKLEQEACSGMSFDGDDWTSGYCGAIEDIIKYIDNELLQNK